MAWMKTTSIVLGAAALAWSCGGGGGGGPTAPEPPTVAPITVGSVRAGEVLVITGTNLSGALSLPAAALVPAQNGVEVLIDGRTLTPESVTDTEIRIRIPLDLEPGPHTLTVRVNSRTSNTITFNVEVFTVTGLYEGSGRIASATCNDPAVEAELRQIFPVGRTGGGMMTALDERPSLTLRSQNFTEDAVLEARGTLDADGTFQATVVDDDPEVTSEKSGRFTVTGAEVRVETVNTITLDTVLTNGFRLICEVRLEFSERRTSTDVSAAPAARAWSAGGSVAPPAVHALRRLLD